MDPSPPVHYLNGSSQSSPQDTPNYHPGPSRLANDTNDSDPATKPARQRDASKKKKATRACFHCQKAHLTCDDTRPCQRCIKRGYGDSCVEGQRKKAKYLLDDEELEVLKQQKVRKAMVEMSPPPNGQLSQSFPADQMFQLPTDPSSAFGSVNANREYSMISALLGPSSASTDASVYPNQWPTDQQPSSHEGYGYNVQPQVQEYPFATQVPLPQAPAPSIPPYLRTSSSTSQSYTGSPISLDHGPTSTPLPGDSSHLQHSSQADPRALINFNAQPFSDTRTSRESLDFDASNDVYHRITAPFDYTVGYHYLMKHLQNGAFDKNDILRVVRALAIFRPSLIALQMPLSAEDEVFVEKCFQRSLTELDKLISMSGTPTVVWRRTGEICLVGLEFSLLTEWSRSELLGGRKYIYELFETQSMVEYWENFANHAFENTTQSVHSHCVLVKPSGQQIPCTFCFSIRRDLFDLPYVVIGQWLPML